MEMRGWPIVWGCILLGMAIIGYVVLSYGTNGHGEEARGLFLYVIPITQLLFQRGQEGATQDKLDRKLSDKGGHDGQE